MKEEIDFERSGANTYWCELPPLIYDEDQSTRHQYVLNNCEETITPFYPCFHRVSSYEKDFRSISPSFQYPIMPRVPSQQLIPAIPQIAHAPPVFNVYDIRDQQPIYIQKSWLSSDVFNSNKKIGVLSKEERRQRIERYLLKKKKRNYKNKSYPCRREAAINRPRYHGRFISYKKCTDSNTNLSKNEKSDNRPKKLFQIRKVR